MVTRARKTADGYRLSGAKKWIGNATIADVAIVWAKVDGEPGVDPESAARSAVSSWRRGRRVSSASLIEGKLSLRAALTAEIEFDDCALPADALLPESGGLRSPLSCLNHARYGIAWGVLGAAMACYDEARQYALGREQFGRPIAGFQLVQAKLARMLTEITKAQLLALRLAQLKDAGTAKHYHISMAKMNNVEIALDAARVARDILGGVGILDSTSASATCATSKASRPTKARTTSTSSSSGQQITGIPAFA